MGANVSDEPGNRNFLEEWKITRSILKEFDERLHDLRKYGFTFLTALLAAEHLLFPTWLTVSDSKLLPDHIKLAVLIINFFLIIGLQVLDRNYLVFQHAAADRGKILERILNLELTEVIEQRFVKKNVQHYVTGLYVAFTCGVVALGSAVLYPDQRYILALILSGFGTSVIIFRLNRSIKLDYPHGKIDWTLDRLQCNSGDEVAITLTNLGEERLWRKDFPACIMWQIVKEDDGEAVEREYSYPPSGIGPGDSYTWLWKTGKNLEEGIYRVHRATDKREVPLKPLKRKLRIRKPAVSSKS